MDEMDSSYSNAPVSPPDKTGDKTVSESVDEQNASDAEILISKDKLPPETKEGSTCTFKVAKDLGDEFILEYVKEDNERSANETPEETTDRELTALDSQESQ